jgi:hypothetical protein
MTSPHGVKRALSAWFGLRGGCFPQSCVNRGVKSPAGIRPDQFRFAILAVCFAFTTLVVTGCRSWGKPASASFASVNIAGHTVEEIQDETVAVFQANCYRAYRKSDGTLVFDKEGSKMNQMAYSGLAGAHYGERIIERVRAEVVDMGGGSHRLQCHAYMVRDPGDGIFEDEIRLLDYRGAPYQKLLEKAADRLK